MKVSFTRSRKKSISLLVGVLLFLSQSIVPGLQGAMAQTVEGYTQTYCTMYGQETIFVAVGDLQQQSDPECLKCPTCIIQANFNGHPEPISLLVDARYSLDSRKQIEPIHLALNLSLFPRFQSRAPPA